MNRWKLFGFLFAISGASAFPVAVHAGSDAQVPGYGHAQGNGGDECEQKILQIRDELLGWIMGGPVGLDLPAGVALDRYLKGMKRVLADRTVSVSCPRRKVYVASLGGAGLEEKTCRNYIERGVGRIECNADRFMDRTSIGGQIRLIHHEYAGLAGFEGTGDYRISDQLGGYSRVERVVKLSLTPVVPDFSQPEFLSVPGKTFEMMKTEVTQLQWYAAMSNNPSGFQLPEHCPGQHSPTDRVFPGYEGFFGCANYPVESLLPTEIDTFVVKKSMDPNSEYLYFLPSSQDWLYVAAAGTKTRFPFQARHDGNDRKYLLLYAWHRPNSEGRTHAVGELLSNPWGFVDMIGNVWEWTSATGIGDFGKFRVIRGQGYNGASNQPASLSTAVMKVSPFYCYSSVGFRLARVKR